MKGLFITFEGGDGSGKSTQIKRLAAYLKEKGYDVLVTREPGGTVIGEKIRDIILDKEHMEMFPMTEALLYAASRAQHVREVLKPAVKSGKIVICDRYIDSSFAYQGYARGLGESVWQINEPAVDGMMPDITFLLRLEPERGKKRINGREEDRIETEKIDFHEKVYNGYMRLKDESGGRIVDIDASGNRDEIARQIIGIVEGFTDDQRRKD